MSDAVNSLNDAVARAARPQNPTWIRWAPGVRAPSLEPLTIHILESGWLRVHWHDRTISYVSPAHVLELGGEVIVSDD